MTSKKSILAGLLIGAMLLTIAGILLSKVTLSGYRVLDQKFIVDDTNRVLRTFKEQFIFLETKIGDWGAWDEAFSYIEGKNSKFVSSNITDKVIGTMKLSFIAFLDENLKIKIAKKFSNETMDLENVDSADLPFLNANHPLMTNSESNAFSGLVEFNGDVMIVAATKISHGAESISSKGRVVFGRIINKTLLNALSEQTLRNISLQREPQNQKDAQRIRIENGVIDIFSSHGVAYLNLTSLENQNLALLKVEVPRAVYAFGKENTKQLLYLYAIMCVAVLGVCFTFFSRKSIQLRFSSLTLANQKLSESEENFRALVESIPGFVFWADKDFRYLGVNKRLAVQNNLTPQDFVGKKIGFLGATTSPDLQEKLSEFTKSTLDFREFDMFITSDTNNTKTTVFLQKFDNGNKVVIVMIDITEKWKLEQQIIKTYEKAAQASRLYSIGQMAAGIAHEVNNPLMIILGLMRKVEKLYQNQEHPESRDLFGKLNETVYRISRIVNGLRAFSRDGSLDALEPTDLCSIMDQTSGICAEKFRNEGIDFRIVHPPHPISIQGRPVQLGQVLVNLLNNAYDAVSSLDKKWVEIAISETDTVVKLTITDSGSGIPDEIAKRIMDPFFTTKAVGKGTGIGLSISKTILENHRGRIYLDDQHPNTRFVIELPKNDAKSDFIGAAA